jgi:hypothetical protein
MIGEQTGIVTTADSGLIGSNLMGARRFAVTWYPVLVLSKVVYRQRNRFYFILDSRRMPLAFDPQFFARDGRRISSFNVA